MTDELEKLRAQPGFTRGHPHYNKDPAIDHLLEIVLQLGAELWVNRDRQAILEHLLETKGLVTKKMIDEFEPSEEFKLLLQEQRDAFTRRVYGCLYAELDTGEKFMPGVIKK